MLATPLITINNHRRDDNRLGFAVQLCVLRYPGWTWHDIKTIPDVVLSHIASQINADSEAFNLYPQRENTLWDHLKEIRQVYGYRNFKLSNYRVLYKSLLIHAAGNGDANYLLNVALNELRTQKIIIPAMTTVERIVWEARYKAEEQIYRTLNSSITTEQKQKLDMLLETALDKSRTPLAWLKEVPSSHSPESFLKVIERLEYLQKLNLNIDMSGINHNRLIQLSRLGKRYEPHSLRRFDDLKKYAILIIYLTDLSQELIDQCIDIHDRQMNFVISKGRKEQDEIQKQNGKSVNEKVINYAALIKALKKAKEENLDPYKTIETIVMPWDELITSGEEADKLARPIDYDYLDLIDCRYNQLRKYTPTLLKYMNFRSTQASESVVKALETIKNVNEDGKRKIPEDAPIDFISPRWNKHVFESDGSINRHYYEMAALTELKNGIRSGNISVVGSRQHKDFDEYLVSKEAWKLAKNTETRLFVSTNVSEYLGERIESLDKRLKWVSTNLSKLEGVSFEKGKIHVERLEKDVPEEARSYSSALYSLIPRVKLTDILSDIASITKFHEQFIHASSKQKPDSNETKILMAALMGIGTNIGLTKMADATPNISYHQMANSAQWRMYDDAINKAQAIIVNYQHKLELTSYWGDGTTSSSDGMRVTTSVPSLHGDTNPHYGFGKGSTIYRFVSDQYSSYHVNVITTNSRDAVHVIDGLLHHETDLQIQEHYTDTAGYTDQVFGLCHLLGFQFAPRIRDISDAKLYTISKSNEYPQISDLLHRVNIKSIQENFDDVLRLSHSIREGSVSASLIMSKLGSYSRQNSLATALREMGYIEKTIFILDYISSKTYRRKINHGLNKGEAMNALARAVFFGMHGEFRDRSIQGQLQKSSALNILLNAITLWNTIYLSKAIEYQRANGTFREDLLPNISPLGWEHINFLGEFNFDSKIKVSLDSLRPLNIPKP